ncbi:MAG: 16S rRNA (cytosine(1402)-N(4))-methyltransferase RsmH [Marinilabiliaceae bacterium]
MSEQYHIPVLQAPAVEGLQIRPSGVYVDLTFGGGGHSRAILGQLGEGGRLIAFDQDEDAWEYAPADEPRFQLVRHNFRYLRYFLDYLGVSAVDGILGDLGVSSHHFDMADRGFSFRFDGALDMRMGPGSEITAARILNEYPEEKLLTLFRKYGEVPSPGRLVKAISSFRQHSSFQRTGQLKEVAETLAPRHDAARYLARVFQALRIEVNGEMEVLKEVLIQMPEVLKSGGRLVVISYHSLEDRMVKNLVRSGNPDRAQADTDLYGNRLVPFKSITRKVIQPSVEEIEQNSRARSAKLRIAERL